MFWRDRERDSSREHNGDLPCGQVRVLVVGDSGVGKTSLLNLIVEGSSTARPPQTIGCTVGVKHISYGSAGSSSNSINGDTERKFFVELWDVSGHERYKDCRPLFYTQINGVIFVHDLSQRRTKTNIQKWASEIAAMGSFSAPLGSGGPGGLPVPYLVIANKADIAAREGTRVSSGNLVDVARQWVEKQGLLPSSEELPLVESFPGSSSLLALSIDGTYNTRSCGPSMRTSQAIHDALAADLSEFYYNLQKIECTPFADYAAKEARYDKEALIKFFRMLIRRRYFADELPAPNSWSVASQPTSILSGDNLSDDDQIQKRFSISGGENYKYNVLAPLPAQRNLTPPPTLYPQQPVSVSASENYSFQRFSASGLSEIKSSRADINV